MITSDKQNSRPPKKVYRIEADEVILNDEPIFRDLNFDIKKRGAFSKSNSELLNIPKRICVYFDYIYWIKATKL